MRELLFYVTGNGKFHKLTEDKLAEKLNKHGAIVIVAFRQRKIVKSRNILAEEGVRLVPYGFDVETYAPKRGERSQ